MAAAAMLESEKAEAKDLSFGPIADDTPRSARGGGSFLLVLSAALVAWMGFLVYELVQASLALGVGATLLIALGVIAAVALPFVIFGQAKRR